MILESDIGTLIATAVDKICCLRQRRLKFHNLKQSHAANGLSYGNWFTGGLHSPMTMSMNIEKNCHEIIEDKIL